MGSAAQSCYLLMLITIPTFILFNSQLTGAAWDLRSNPEKGSDRGASSTGTWFLDDGRELVEKVSGEDNVGGDLLTKIRVLLGLKTSNSVRPTSGVELKIHGFSPAPAPVEEALTQAPIPSFHKHAYTRSPLPHKTHIPPVHHLEEGGRDGAKAMRVRTIVVVFVVSVGATIIIFGATMALVCKRSQRSQERRSQRTRPLSSRRSKAQIPSNATNKVSFDPGPDLFYINSLQPFLETDSSLKQSSESKNVLSIKNENILSSPSPTPELMKCEMDNVSCLDEEIHPIEPLLSDDESFHSVCNSHSSAGLVSVVSDEDLSHPSVNCSPFNSSYRSTSPNCRLIHHSSTKSPMPPTSPASTFSIPLNLMKPPCSSLESKTSQSPSSNIQDATGSLRSSHTLLGPSNITKIQSDLPSIETPSAHSKDSKSSSPIAETPIAPLNLELSSIPMQTTSPHPSMSSSNSFNKPTQSPSMFSNVILIPKPPPPPQSTSALGNGNIPKPPPPPQGNVSIAKPPPPPPLPPLRPPSFQRGFNTSHPPPPPPRPLQQSTPVGKDGAPLPKLKPLHWDKVRAAPDRSMVWDKIRSSSFELDEEMIESLFGYNIQITGKNEEAKNKTSSPSKHVLDHKRLQNITILLKALNVTSEQVCDALTQGRGLSVQQLEALVKMVPTKEEEEKLSKYEGDITELGPAEQFIKAVLKIPFAFSRIIVMLYKETFEDEVVHLRKSFEMLEEACKELRSSRLFSKLLEAVLKTGNRMNVGTVRGGARAFKLDALLKLADVKGTDGKTTLLHFVVQEMIRSEGGSAMEKAIRMKSKPKTAEEKEEDIRLMGLDLVSGLSTELSNVKKTASIDLDVLVTSVSNLSSDMGQLKQLTEVDLLSDYRSGSFVVSMKCFLNHAQRVIQELKDDEDKVLLHVREITEYYHGDVSKDEANPLRIFVIVRDFLGMLDRVCKEVRSLKTHLGPNPVIPFH